ncbi:hypothetical protein BHE74_00038934 [Ensete ventricosum]|nr:hypothetical protein GW17_00039713 [Ensete ventricosum]RWW54484.1 hypothetical protein BHE74_00038934 [Ensete ventricosum]RZR86334.1 hypothetical protein BHM03_00013506 [Ensete ventricosum]
MLLVFTWLGRQTLAAQLWAVGGICSALRQQRWKWGYNDKEGRCGWAAVVAGEKERGSRDDSGSGGRCGWAAVVAGEEEGGSKDSSSKGAEGSNDDRWLCTCGLRQQEVVAAGQR